MAEEIQAKGISINEMEQNQTGLEHSRREKMSIRKTKKKLDRVMAKYIKARDTNKNGYCVCCSCGRIKLPGECDAGHYIGKGQGGASGIRFDERNVHIQCRQCNYFGGQKVKEAYREFILKKYGQDIVEELKIKDKTHTYTLIELEGLLLHYKEETKICLAKGA